MTTVSANDKSLEIKLDGKETGELHDILTVHLREFLDLFIRKNKEYGENAQTLGPRGQFSDMYRKMIKLRTGMWDGDEHLLTSESVDEILLDMIGHCFLTLRMRARDRMDKQPHLDDLLSQDLVNEIRKRIDVNNPLRVTADQLSDILDEIEDQEVDEALGEL